MALCNDCGTETLPHNGPSRAEWYKVRDDVWFAAGMKLHTMLGHDVLCIGCLETRLGRTLTSADFKPGVAINDLTRCDDSTYAWSFRTERLIDRLQTPPPYDTHT